jgi:hypothetical protein
MRRDRRDSDRNRGPNPEEFREPTAGKPFKTTNGCES